MRTWVLLYEEHYSKYLASKHLEKSTETFKDYLKTIGTPRLLFGEPLEKPESNYLVFLEVPEGTCIRLRTEKNYVTTVHRLLYPELREPQDKSRRSSSCVIV